MRALGIDPGIERLGWALVEKTPHGMVWIASGVKKTSKLKRAPSRLLEIFEFLDNLIALERPHILATEKLFFAKNAKTASIIGEARGVILTAGEKHGLSIKEFTPLQVKLAICGHGTADKKILASMLRFSIKLPEKKMLDDETDAIGIAVTGLL